MRHYHWFKVGLTCVAILLSGVSQAAETNLDLRLPSSQVFQHSRDTFLLAAADAEVDKVKANLAPVVPATEYEAPTFSKSNMHKYLGIGTIVLAGLTAVNHPEECEGSCSSATYQRDTNGTHATLAKATVAMAAATIATGVAAHWNDFSLEDGWSDPDNLHVLLAVTGAAMMAYAVNRSANSSTEVSHAGQAELGALTMVLAIKLTW